MKSFGFFGKKFYFYLLKELLLLFFLSLVIFTFILVLSNLGKMADLVINKGVDIKDIGLLIVFSSPPVLTFTLPMSFLLSTVLVLGRLSSENEILLLKANGINLNYLFVPVAILATAVLIAGFVNTSFAISKSAEALRAVYINILKKGISFDDKEGVFNDSVKGIVIYVNRVDARSNTLHGILISDDRDEAKGVKQTFTAETGSVTVDDNTFDVTFSLKNGSGQRWEKQSDTFSTFSFENHTLSMNLKQILTSRSGLRKKYSVMSIKELERLLSVEKDPETRYDIYLEIPKKLSIPCSVIALMLLAVPLGIKRRTEGKFSGVVYSLLIFVVYYILTALVENLGKTYRISPFLISFTPNIVFSFLGLYLIKDLNREEQGGILAGLKYLWEPHCAKVK